MEPIQGSETSANYDLTPGKYPKEHIQIVDLYLISISGPSWPILGLPFYLLTVQCHFGPDVSCTITALEALCDCDKCLFFWRRYALCCVSKYYCHSNLQVYFGTAQARIYLVADFLRVNCHTGMSALMRKTLIDEVGGIEAFSCYLAEDFFLAKSLKERGWRMCISSQPAWQNSGVCEINSFQARLTRSVSRTKLILDFRLSPWFEYCIFSSGYFPGVKL